MPNWNGLGYQQLAQTRLSQKADRSQQGWMKFVDTMNKYFETQGAQQYELNQKLPLQQQYNKEIQGMSDTSALERIRLDIEGAGARQTESLKANADLRAKYDLTTGQQLGENALDRSNQLAAQGQGKTTEPKGMLDYLTSASYVTYGLGPNGVFGGFPSIKDDSEGKRADKIRDLRIQFEFDTQNDPNKKALLAQFDKLAKAPTAATSNAPPVSPIPSVNRQGPFQAIAGMFGNRGRTDEARKLASSFETLMNTYSRLITADEKKQLNQLWRDILPETTVGGYLDQAKIDAAKAAQLKWMTILSSRAAAQRK
jgi:hypothetical protein